MHSYMQTEKLMGLPAHCPNRLSADQAIKHWMATEEDQRLWQATCPDLSQEGLYNALVHAHATRFGLLLTHRGAIIWSWYSHPTYTRLAPLYEEAAQTGLCFWWEGGTFTRVGKEAFLERITTLPAPRAGTNSARSPASSPQWPNGWARAG